MTYIHISHTYLAVTGETYTRYSLFELSHRLAVSMKRRLLACYLTLATQRRRLLTSDVRLEVALAAVRQAAVKPLENATGRVIRVQEQHRQDGQHVGREKSRRNRLHSDPR